MSFHVTRILRLILTEITFGRLRVGVLQPEMAGQLALPLAGKLTAVTADRLDGGVLGAVPRQITGEAATKITAGKVTSEHPLSLLLFVHRSEVVVEAGLRRKVFVALLARNARDPGVEVRALHVEVKELPLG